MADTPKPPPVVEIKPETKSKLDDAVARYYALLKEGKGVGESKEGDEAAKELADVVRRGLKYDPKSERWVDQDDEGVDK